MEERHGNEALLIKSTGVIRNSGPSVKIVLLKAGIEVGTIAASVPIGNDGKGYYTWDINPTGATGSDYRVKRAEHKPTDYQRHEQYIFHHYSRRTNTFLNYGHQRLMAEKRGKRGTSHRVNWSYTGSPGSTVKIILWKGRS